MDSCAGYLKLTAPQHLMSKELNSAEPGFLIGQFVRAGFVLFFQQRSVGCLFFHDVLLHCVMMQLSSALQSLLCVRLRIDNRRMQVVLGCLFPK